MEYFIAFLEGIITFISPCLLPMLPIYITYFAGGKERSRSKTLVGALGFVAGFTLIFVAMGALAGTVGAFLTRYQTVVNIVSGTLVILFGLSYLEVIRLPFFKGMQRGKSATTMLSAFLFGVVYSVNLTPCVGAFLGTALTQAATSGTALRGTLLLTVYSLGLGVPFALSAVLIEKLGGAFSFIKRHYRIINLICGIFLILVGIFMMLGKMQALLALFT